MLIMNDQSNPMDLNVSLCLCALERGCKMIHLAVLLPAAVSLDLIRRETESISFTSSP